ncbi:HEAT repeat domain-containing protein [Breznakiella homolactica]|uniref:HEAT repeat domain-containing protein n=1 Tax=Breznakiella homolactica TaxID=2798577 RepID=A0A7T7XKE7_9SPIR|nr:hypothetical protein [Breznakiella homolactica]QQO08034.1 hypothetical protein JFL75_13920 [Breznakiella homolactica]
MIKNHKLRGKTLRRLGFSLILLILPIGLFAQEPILVSYQRNFVRANLATKTGILRDAATDERAAEFIGPLYEYSLDFSLRHADILRDDPDMIALTVLAAQGVGQVAYKPSVNTLWRVFLSYRDSLTRVEVLKSLAITGKGNPQVVENLNQFLANQNNLFRSGMVPDYPTLSACIAALAELGDGSSFPVLFSSMIAGYPENITGEIAAALSSISGDYKNYLIMVIQRNPPVEKLAAFNAGQANERFTDEDRGEIAEVALGATLDLYPSSSESETAAAELRYSAVRVLTRLKWSKASEAVIKHFYRVQADYANGTAEKKQFLEAIAALGAMSSSEAAQALALQLGLFNSQMERSGEYDDEVIIAVINALGEIGDKIAFDYLLYIGYLSYPESVQSAARDALNRLRW